MNSDDVDKVLVVRPELIDSEKKCDRPLDEPRQLLDELDCKIQSNGQSTSSWQGQSCDERRRRRQKQRRDQTRLRSLRPDQKQIRWPTLGRDIATSLIGPHQQ